LTVLISLETIVFRVIFFADVLASKVLSTSVFAKLAAITNINNKSRNR